MKNKKRIVITGFGAVTPIGLDVNTFWKNLLLKKSGASEITSFDSSNFNVHFACEVKDFNPSNYLNPKEIRRINNSTCFAFAAADEAIKHANLNCEKDKYTTGVIIGTGIGGISSVEKEYTKLFDIENSYSFPDPFFVNKIVTNTPSSFISLKFGLHGPSFGVSSACSSSLSAIVSSYNMIQLGMADVMIVGGTESAITPWSISNFDAIRALSRKNDDPQTASRPFDETRDGFVLGEGAGVIVLESLDHALERNTVIYAELSGYGICSEAYHITSPDPSGQYITKVISDALKNSDILPEEVDYVNMHATSTKLGDLTEAKAMHKIFNKTKCKMSSTKSNIGHLLGGAGAVETIACLGSIQNNIIPATINTTKIEEDIKQDLHFIINENEKCNVDVAINNSFGFGGHNVSIVLKKFVL